MILPRRAAAGQHRRREAHTAVRNSSFRTSQYNDDSENKRFVFVSDECHNIYCLRSGYEKCWIRVSVWKERALCLKVNRRE